jgi:beta-glucosidase
MGQEFHDKGAHVMLGPGMNVQRVQENGRGFEYLSGEDPVVGRELVPHMVKGIQDQKVLANAKHFIDNSQENNRTTVSENVDERTNFEMYYPPFQAAIDADVASFMCSYNKVNGDWSCENGEIIGTHLRAFMGFKGYVMSDWQATHSVALDKGLDQEMGRAPKYYNESSLEKFKGVPVDFSVYRIFYQLFDKGVLDDPRDDNVKKDVRTERAYLASV